MQKVQLLEDRFSVPDDFDANQYFSTAWGIMGGRGEVKVSLCFAAESMPLIKERHWHVSQQVEELPGGGCRLVLWVKDWREMRPWIRSWGSQVEVEEPLDLREDIARDVQRVAAMYEPSRAG